MDAEWELIGFVVIAMATVIVFADVAQRCRARAVSIADKTLAGRRSNSIGAPRSGKRNPRRLVRADQHRPRRPRYGSPSRASKFL
jgi:hypothetical protein